MGVVYDSYSTRDAFGKSLLEMAKENPQIYAVSADTTKSMGYEPMRREFPNRVINVGISEQNMALTAAGIASCGGKAFCATYAPFAAMRMLEQVRSFIAYPNLDVKVISGLGGLSGNVEGTTHQGLEDVSIMRCIPGIVVVVPADSCSTEEITRVITRHNGPVYLRVGRGEVPKVFDSYKFEIGKANPIKTEGADIAFICNGAAVHRVLQADKLLAEKGISAQIIEMPCVKPIDEDAILAAARTAKRIVAVEENNIVGGLGGAVAEVLSSLLPTPLLRLGIADCYTESGPHAELMDKYGLDPIEIASRTENFFSHHKSV
ncbi:MAG: transketolase family protein [Defluviitaleaceae bacterium]|nr:transketolase family protein [Defluviitaleaceae bacterium]